jgi:predicted deacylase
MKFSLYLITASLMFIGACKNYKATVYPYPDLVDTSDKPIIEQEKKTYQLDGVYADNRFDGARLNDFSQVDQNTFKATIQPENTPINKSPWFAFKIWSDKKRKINLILDYEYARHRYIPKLSTDRQNWVPIDTLTIRYLDTADIVFPLSLDTIPLYVSGQELIPSKNIYQWIDTLTLSHKFIHGVYGTSVKGRDLVYMDIFENSKKDKPMVVILSRQHPPELSGFLAMQHFVHALLDTNVLARNYRQKFRTLVLPLLNPDGVDMGHWRHNAHGVDLNRDWGIYVQPEIRQTVDFIVRESKMNDNRILLGLDFHSTQKDIFYTYVDSMVSVIPRFNDYWIMGIDEALPNYEPEEEPSGITQPFSKVWFYTQFGAESITYEIGDETPRDFIRQKATVSANEMMQLLIFYNP